jgi:D-lactate dehydrogenase
MKEGIVKHQVAVFDSKPYDIEALQAANSRYHFDLNFFEPTLTQQTAPLAQGFPVLCLFIHDEVNAQLAETLSTMGVQLLALRSNGYNHIDLGAAAGKFKVVRVPKYSPYSVAEYTLGLILSMYRKLHFAYMRTKTNNFSLKGLEGKEVHGKTAGVIGTGQIGAIVVRLLSSFGMRILVHDVVRNDQLVHDTGCEYTDLPTLYKESDIITLHCPLLPTNTHCINADAIAQMKNGVLIVNTSRGGLVDTSALIEGLKSKKVGGAALDVYEEEDRFFYEDLSGSFIDDDLLARLMTFPNVFVSAHGAFFTQEAVEEIAETTLANIQEFFEGKPLHNEVIRR